MSPVVLRPLEFGAGIRFVDMTWVLTNSYSSEIIG